jgi:hypothetical protein
VLHALELDIVLLTIEKIPFILEYTFNSFNLNSPGFMHNKLDMAIQYLTISKCHVSEGRLLNMQSDMVKLSFEWARERERARIYENQREFVMSLVSFTLRRWLTGCFSSENCGVFIALWLFYHFGMKATHDEDEGVIL